jgi:photosystem II stability/assembly factor-like uncharacterized protein
MGGDAIILKTTNGGTNWTKQTYLCEIIGLYSVYFINADTGYAVGEDNGGLILKITNDGLILKTTNGGTNWSKQTSGTTNDLFSVYFTDANTGYIVGDTGLILKTTNAGTNWTAQISGTTNPLYSVYFPAPNTGYAVGKSGTILKTTNGGVWLEEKSKAENINIYPNPANTTITIKTPGIAGKSLLSVYNINGQELIKQKISKSKTQLDISNLPSGVYIVKLVNEKAVEVRKFVKE